MSDSQSLELERLGWLLLGSLVGILATAAGAYIQFQISANAHRRESWTALAAEIDENLVNFGQKDDGTFPRPVVRSAWDAARSSPVPPDLFTALSIAYSLGAALNSRIAITDRHYGAPVAADPNSEAWKRITRHQDELSNATHAAADAARIAFRTARPLLARHRGLPVS